MTKKSIIEIQKNIIKTNQGKQELLNELGNQQNFNVDEFIVTENVNYKVGVNPNAAPNRKLAADIIIDSLENNFGTDYTSVAIRGDNRCSQRSLMAGTLIAARRLIYQNRKEEAYQLIDKLGELAHELRDRRNEVQFKHLAKDFNEENYKKFKNILDDIKQEKIGITDLVLQANSDFSIQYIIEADSFNLALSSLAAFIMDKKLEEHAIMVGMSKNELSDESAQYAVLTPGIRASTSADREAFLSTLNIKHTIPILRIESILEPIIKRNIKSVEDARNNGETFRTITTENQDGKIDIATFNSAGHTNLILIGADKVFMLQELNKYHNAELPSESFQIEKEVDEPQQIIQGNPPKTQEIYPRIKQNRSLFETSIKKNVEIKNLMYKGYIISVNALDKEQNEQNKKIFITLEPNEQNKIRTFKTIMKLQDDFNNSNTRFNKTYNSIDKNIDENELNYLNFQERNFIPSGEIFSISDKILKLQNTSLINKLNLLNETGKHGNELICYSYDEVIKNIEETKEIRPKDFIDNDQQKAQKDEIASGAEKIKTSPPASQTFTFFQPAKFTSIERSAQQNKHTTEIEKNPSSLSTHFIARITQQIGILNREINSCWPYPNKDRKQIKVNALKFLLEKCEEGQDVRETVNKIKETYPLAMAGGISQRTATLLNDIECEATDIMPSDSFNNI